MVKEAGGTQAATIGTEHTLHTNATTKTMVLMVDVGAMALGDELELRVKTKMLLAGDTLKEAFVGHFAHVQSQPIVQSIPLPSDIEAVFTLKQTVGTGRSFPWKVMSL